MADKTMTSLQTKIADLEKIGNKNKKVEDNSV
jgi:hypothetical protein